MNSKNVVVAQKRRSAESHERTVGPQREREVVPPPDSLLTGLASGLSHPSRFSPTTFVSFNLARSRAIVSRRAFRSRSRW